MAFTNKPFVWKNDGVTPPETLQNSGFIGGKKLPAPYVNAQWTATYKAIEELQQKAGEVKTVNNVQPDINGNVLIPLPDVSKFYQKPAVGIPKTDLSADVQTSLEKANDALQSVPLATAALDGLMAKGDKVSLDNVMSVFANLQKMKITNDDGSAVYTIGETLPPLTRKGIFYTATTAGSYAPPVPSVEGIIISESGSYWNFIGASDDGTWCVATYRGGWKGWTTLATAKDVSNLSTRITALETSDTTHQADLVSHGIYGVATGTNALVMTDSKVTQYVDGMLVAFKNTTASTAATTLNINNLGAKAILKANGTAVNNLKTNAIYQLRYNDVNFILLGEGGEYGNVTANDVVAGKTFGTENGLQTGSATVASLGGIISSDIALFSAIANENGYEVSEVDKNTGKIAYGSYSTLPMIGCFGDLNGKMISQKSVNTPSYVRLVGWYIDYYVTYLPSSGVITFYNHDDNVIFSFNYIVNTGIYGICLYQDTVIITEFDSSTQTLLTTYKNKTGGTISSFSKILSSNLFTLGKNLKLNLYKVPFIYQYYIFSSDRYFTVGLIKLNGINTITHKRFYGDFTEPSLRFLKDYITK